MEVQHSAVAENWRRRCDALTAENVMLSAAVEALQKEIGDKDAQIARLLARSRDRRDVSAPASTLDGGDRDHPAR
jgi:hypothetical protein